jgi:hypothetical protein
VELSHAYLIYGSVRLNVVRSPAQHADLAALPLSATEAALRAKSEIQDPRLSEEQPRNPRVLELKGRGCFLLVIAEQFENGIYT